MVEAPQTHDYMVEQSLCASVLQGLHPKSNDAEAHRAIKAVPIEAFLTTQGAHVWQALLSAYEQTADLDEVAVKLALRKAGHLGATGANWKSYKTYLDKAAFGRIPTLVAGLVGDHRRRSLQHLGYVLQERAKDPMLDPLETVSEAQSALGEIQGAGTSLTSECLADEVREVMASMGGRLDNPKVSRLGWWGIQVLDDAFPLGQGMTVIGARPNVGKSILGAQVAITSAEKGKNVLYLNLDMPHFLIRKRLLACASKVPQHVLARGEFSVPQKLDFDNGMRTLGRVHLKSMPATTPWSMLEAVILEHIRSFGIEIVVLDYFQQIGRKHSTRGQSDASAWSAVSAGIKAISQRPEAPLSVVLLSQVGRDGSMGEPALNELKETGALEQDALGVVLLWSDPPEAEPEPAGASAYAKATPKSTGKFTNSDNCHARLAKSQLGPVGAHVRITRRGDISRFDQEDKYV